MRVSARRGEGMEAGLSWLRDQLNAQRERLATGKSRRPAIQPEGAQLHAQIP